VGYVCHSCCISDGQFTRLVYDEFTGSYRHIDNARCQVETRAAEDEAPNNCPVCLLFEEQNQKAAPHAVEFGVAMRGFEYHLWDFVLFYGRNGPCEIGYITDIHFPKSHRPEALTTVQIKRVGRIASLVDILPAEELKDEVFYYFEQL
jgi:DNA (cytosine-5)-methyltransferase 1